MIAHVDLEYLCTNLANLSAIPVRLFEGESEIFYSSIVDLPIDPFLPYKKEVFAITSHVGYFITPHDWFYGVVNFDGKRIVAGPTRQVPISEQELKTMAFEQSVPRADVEDFIKGMKSIMTMPLTAVLQMLANFNHVVNDGETLTLTDLAIYDYEQEKMTEVLAQESAARTIDKLEGADVIYAHNTMDVEAYILAAVRKGDVIGLQNYFAKMPAVRKGLVAQDHLRQEKNILIVTATLVSREAIRGGMDAEEALSLSESYIQKCELSQSSAAVINLNYRMILDYAERMETLNYGGKPSPLVTEIINYVRNHLSEFVTVEDLARHLCKGRSRLSTDFKKETGENLSEFILKLKIDEAKRLLRYTDKPSVDIAFYLGFSSQSHFSRTFKKHVDLTPNEYRATRKNQ